MPSRTTDELSHGYDGPEERFMKLEDMMIELRKKVKDMMNEQRNMIAQLSDRVGLLEKKN